MEKWRVTLCDHDFLAYDPTAYQLFHATHIEPVVDEEETGDEVADQAIARPAQESGPWERDSPPDADHVPAAPMRPRRYGLWATFIVVMAVARSEEHTSELQSRENLVCRLLLEKKKKNTKIKK